MKKYSFKRYAGVTMALFGAAALSLLLFFALFRIDAIHKAFSHICKTLMPFIIGGVLAYVICPICNFFDNIYNKVFKFIKNETSFDGIISTKGNLIKQAKNYGLVAIQRFFVFDTISLNNSKNHVISECDAIEILPGVIPKVIKDISTFTKKPIVAGGLIDSKEDVILALNSGATCVSTSKTEIWGM